jgi:hypothetical protein
VDTGRRLSWLEESDLQAYQDVHRTGDEYARHLVLSWTFDWRVHIAKLHCERRGYVDAVTATHL